MTEHAPPADGLKSPQKPAATPPDVPPLGLVLRLRPWQESDVLVDMFSDQYGRITALAKGGRRSIRRFTGLLLSGQLLQMEIDPGKKSDLWLLRKAGLVAAYVGLRQDYRRWLAAGPVLEMLLRGTPQSLPAPSCLYLALLSLKRLETSKNTGERQTALLIFLNRFLHEIGFGLYLEKCLACQKPLLAQPLSLTLEGGVLCAHCAPFDHAARQVPRGLVSALLAGQKLPLDALNRLAFAQSSLPEGLAFISLFSRRMLGHDLPSLDFIDYI